MIELGEIYEDQLTKNPEFYFRLERRQRVIQNNLLWSSGKYFDLDDKVVRKIPESIPEDDIKIDDDYNLIVPKETPTNE